MTWAQNAVPKVLGGNEYSEKASNGAKDMTFLTLPLDIRRMVYEYLIPDETVPSKRPFKYPRSRQTNTFWQPLRHDKAPLSIAILLTDRQIYEEIIEMWYAAADFHLGIGTNMQTSLCMLSEDFKLPFQLPGISRLIRKIHLCISLQADPFCVDSISRSSLELHVSKENALVAGLVDRILSSKHKLCTLDLNVQVGLSFWKSHVFKADVYSDPDSPVPYETCRRDAESTIMGLKYNLEPLRRLRNVQMSKWSISTHLMRGMHCELGFRDDGEIGRVREEMMDAARPYMRGLESDMKSGTIA